MKNLLKFLAPVLILVALLFAGCDWGSTPTYTVTYDANGAGPGSVPIDSTAYLQDQIVTVLDNTGDLVRTGYTYAGWNTAADGSGDSYIAGQTFAMGAADVVLHAIWTLYVPSWTVLFEDDFNRSDTTGMDLGSNWTITGSGADEMYISGNEVYSVYSTPGVGVISAYNGTVDYTEKLRISVKFKINNLNGWPVEMAGLGICVDTTSWESYCMQLNYSDPNHVLMLTEFDGTAEVGTVTTNIPSLVNDTWYLLEMESDGTTLTATVRDETGAIVIGTIILTDDPRTYMTGKILFYNYTVNSIGNPLGYPVYFDDFKLEAFR